MDGNLTEEISARSTERPPSSISQGGLWSRMSKKVRNCQQEEFYTTRVLKKLFNLKQIPTLGSAFKSSSSSPSPSLVFVPPFSRYLMDNVRISLFQFISKRYSALLKVSYPKTLHNDLAVLSCGWF